jgi:hypothetical protein
MAVMEASTAFTFAIEHWNVWTSKRRRLSSLGMKLASGAYVET